MRVGLVVFWRIAFGLCAKDKDEVRIEPPWSSREPTESE
jgi:hypothetical protein